jgi:hypothetical protein
MVLIELQKAKLYQQLMRFRRYLGQQYQHAQHVDEADNPLPIYPIYILGEPISTEEIPVIRVQRGIIEAATGEELQEDFPFIEALTHDATIIQTKYLQGKRRTELERFLGIFDQSNIADTKGHILKLSEADYPPAYRPVIRKLQQALADPQLDDNMDLEDEVMKEFQKKEDEIVAARKMIEEAQRREEEARIREEETQRRFVRVLADQGTSIATICELTGLEEEDVRRLLTG